MYTRETFRMNPKLPLNAIRALALGAVAACLAMPGSAQTVPAEVYGPYNAVFLADGPGLPKTDATLHSKGTLSFWFNASEPLTKTSILAGLGDPASSGAQFVAVEDNRLEIWLGGQKVAASSTLSSAAWHLAVLVNDGQSLTLYADGQQVASSAVPQGKSAAYLNMAPALVGAQHFGGKIAALKMYSEALSATQVAELAANAPDFSIPTYEEASARWPIQVKGQAGLSAPQDPSTLPRGKGGIQKPVAKPVTAADLQNQLVGGNPWKLVGGWKLEAAPKVKAPGAELSAVGYEAKDWMVATVPGTVLTTMIDRGIYPDSDYGLNNLAIPESLAHQDYWYRVEFKTPAQSSGQRLTLTFEGVNYAAEVWLNGKKLGGFTGAFLRGNFDVTGLVNASGNNALAVRVCPPPHPGIAHEQSIKGGAGDNGGIHVIDGPTFSATEGWDWIPGIRDRNTGIWQDVILTASGTVSVGDLQVVTTLPKSDRSEADVEIEAPLTNASGNVVEGDLTASFDDVKVVKHVTLAPGETVVRLQPTDYAQLKVQNPRLWWPNGYGEPTLHALTVNFAVNGAVSSEQKIDFGMREVSYETSLMDTTGHLRRVEVLPSRTHDESLPLIDESHNGIRHIDDPMPSLTAEGKPAINANLAWVFSLRPEAEGSASIRPVEGGWPGTDLVIRVNGVRIAARGGNWGMDDSRKRVSVEHLEPFFRLHRDAHVNFIRDWMGQDSEESFYALADKYGMMVWNDFWESTQGYNLEIADPALFLQNARDSILHFRHHPSIVVWCGRNEGVPQPIVNEGLADLVRTLDHTRYYTGSSNKVNLRDSGPYKLQPAESYYRINRGFSVELGIPSVPTLEGIKAFMPEADRWPISDTWAYHDWHQKGGGSVEPFMKHLAEAYGEASSLEDFERKAQMIDYVGHRAIFEGFAAHLWQPNAARMIWMTQPAWPSMSWNFLGSDYDTQSSFYATQKACEPVHAQLDLIGGTVDLINLGAAHSYKVRSRVLSLDGKVLNEQSSQVQAAENARTVVSSIDLAKLAAGHTILVQLQVSESNGAAVSDNFYWWSKEEGTLRELNNLAQAKLAATAKVAMVNGERQATVKIKNTGTAPVLLVKLTLKDAVSGERILPAYYSENYVSLLAGEERVIKVNFPAGETKPAIGLRAWNLSTTTVNVQ